jgi:hypothetical protein
MSGKHAPLVVQNISFIAFLLAGGAVEVETVSVRGINVLPPTDDKAISTYW